jgi:hypothetical protein
VLSLSFFPKRLTLRGLSLWLNSLLESENEKQKAQRFHDVEAI